MQFTDRQLTILGFGALFIVLVGVLVYFGRRPDVGGQKTVELVIWGTEDPSRVWSDVILGYQAQNSKVNVKYIEFPEDTYEEELLNALGEGAGPDIFMFRNTWLLKHYKKATPAPAALVTKADVARLFPETVTNDLVLSNADGGSSVYALPLYVDTLALLYNKDTFDAKKIAMIPETWDDLSSVILRLRELNQGAITKAAAAVGGSSASVLHAPEIMELLMRQYGAEMVDMERKEAMFDTSSSVAALKFYIGFTDPKNKYYTWSDKFALSIDSFSQKKVTMILGYARDISKIKEKNAYLRVGVATMPQRNIEEAVNAPDYWGLAVSAQSKSSDAAWGFISYVTANPDIMRKYMVATGKPPALRSLINEQLASPELGVFAAQALTARSWPQVDPKAVATIFDTMIRRAADGSVTPENAVKQAAEDVSTETQRWK